MSYLVLSRKYRPHGFDAVSGQEHVTKVLKNAIKRNRIGHAYLFTGPRGVGKTSIARIFSKALNCVNGPTIDPCLECLACNEITKGISLSVLEIDGASHNSVDNVRDLIETFRSLPSPGYKYKVYIIDEVHMLSVSAFNALLKSLEEPPPNTVFILATTEVHKIPDTVLSRCQRHDLRALSVTQIKARLQEVINQENIKAEEEAIQMIARAADGSLRDAQSLLERIIAYCDGTISAEETGSVLGFIQKRVLFALSEAILSRDINGALTIVSDTFSTGIDPAVFLKQFVAHFREALVVKFTDEKVAQDLHISKEDIVEMKRLVGAISTQDIQDLTAMAVSGADSALRSYHTRFALEALVVRMASRVPVHEISKLIDRLKGQNLSSSPVNTNRGTTAPVNVRVNQSVATTPAALSDNMPPLEKTIDNTSSSREQSLDWMKFITFFLTKGEDRILGEQLKRLVVEDFRMGSLRAKGVDFPVKYLSDESNKARLITYLSNFASHSTWRISLTVATEKELATIGSSIRMSEKVNEEVTKKDREQKAIEHPALKNLQKVFPGSTIDNVRLKN